MISVAEALALIAQHRPSAGVQTLELRDILGRRIAQDVVAALTQPPLNASAMDGYAAALDDVKIKDAILKVIGEAPAGAPFSGTVTTGQAVRIFTGGAVPQGADTVIIQENVNRHENSIQVIQPQTNARHIRFAGIDFFKGDVLFQSGTLMGHAEIAVAAASGHPKLKASKKLRAAILSGGDELIAPGETPLDGQIINSNPYAIAALIESWGHEAIILPTARDTAKSINTSIALAKDTDVIIPVGGASVGDHDHMRTAFKDAGLDMIFEKIAVRPGKPTWFGLLNEKAVLGLPGNPASALVCAHLFVRPLLTGQKANFLSAVLAEDMKANGPRETYQRAVAKVTPDGIASVSPLPMQDSGLMTPFLKANCLLKLAANAPLQSAGNIAEVLPIKALI